MTRFEESALRNSAIEEPNPATLPYWHPESQFSSLIDPHRDVGTVATTCQNVQALTYPSFADDRTSGSSQPSNLDFEAPESQRHMNFGQFNDFPQMPHGIPQNFGTFEQMSSAMPKLDQGLTIKTPTGPRTMRRPGLAGATALINGQYCCQWSTNGAACRHKFLDAKSLNDHIKANHVRGNGSFVCYWSGCDKGSFPTANKLVRHVHSHTGYKPFPCGHCSQAFVTKDQLDKHLTTHTGAKDFICTWPGCGRSFAVKHALDGHMNSVHLKAKKHTCPHCAQAFDDSSNLSKHKKQVHNVETGIKCPARHTHNCTYVDSRKDKMKEHCEQKQHGLETVNNPHAWNLWVQQYKSASKKSESRRQSVLNSRPISRASSVSTSSCYPLAQLRGSSIECSKQGCNIPVCLPCNILCNDLHTGHNPLPPCDEANCDPCDDTDCDVATRQPCNIPPCSISHCRSASSTPSSLPATPYGTCAESYYQYQPITAAENDIFHDADHPFQIGTVRLNDCMFLD